MLIREILKSLRNFFGNTFALSRIDELAYSHINSNHVPVFIVGAPRTGTTLIYQVLTSQFFFSYFTNLTSFLYGSPLLAHKLSKLIPEHKSNFNSNYGFIRGLNSPSEAGHTFRLFLEGGDRKNFGLILNSIMANSNSPIISKNVYNSFRMVTITKSLSKAIFIVMSRDSRFVMQSLIRARRNLYKSDTNWFGLKYPGFEKSLHYNPIIQTGLQIKRTNDAISTSEPITQ